MENSNSTHITAIYKVAFASCIGTAIEWYDFFIYTYATTIIFNRLFFPNSDDWFVGLLYSFGANATGFLARLIGAVVCGHLGDRIGRKLILIFTLLLIGFATFLIGILPTYQTIGILAPFFLVVFRLAQGFAIGGGWIGAIVMAIEYSSPEKRGFFGSLAQVGVPVGLFLSTLSFTLILSFKDTAIETGWWRLVFLFSIFLLPVGLYIRVKIDETPLFKGVISSKKEAHFPILEVLVNYPKNILLIVGAKLVGNAVFYAYTSFLLVLSLHYKINTLTVLLIITLASFLAIFTIPAFGYLSDRLGRKKVCLAGTIFTGLFAYPFFKVFISGNVPLIILAMIVALPIGHGLIYGPQASFFSEIFVTRLRYSGSALGNQIAAIFGGGIFPLAATYFLKVNPSLIILTIVCLSIISTVSILFIPETYKNSLESG